MGAANYTALHPRKSFMFEIFALLGCYAVYIGNYLPTYQDKLSVPSSREDVSVSYHPQLIGV
jgi:hypothetical protein